MDVKSILAKSIAHYLLRKQITFEHVQEIRMRIGKQLILIYEGRELVYEKLITKVELEETLGYISQYSFYAYEHELSQGYLVVEGGHRVGIAGQVVTQKGRIQSIKYISSINIRIAHEIKSCADFIFPYIVERKHICHTLLVSPPGCGKTTMLRDVIRQASDGNQWMPGCTVGVVDERSEIGSSYMGIVQNDLGIRTDVLDRCPKSEGMLFLIRSMTPKIVAVDEIGMEDDVAAIVYAMHCGCKVVATAHGSTMDDLKQKRVFHALIQNRRFERYVFLDNRETIGNVVAIYDQNEEMLFCRKSSGQH